MQPPSGVGLALDGPDIVSGLEILPPVCVDTGHTIGIIAKLGHRIGVATDACHLLAGVIAMKRRLGNPLNVRRVTNRKKIDISPIDRVCNARSRRVIGGAVVRNDGVNAVTHTA